jgi:hypothetical protein
MHSSRTMIDGGAPPPRRENWEEAPLIRTISAGALGLLIAATGVAMAQDADDDDDFGDAVVGGIVGMGIGKILFDDE